MTLNPRARVLRLVLTWLSALALLLVSSPALAFTPPALEGPVTDPGSVLSEGDRRALNEKLRRYKVGSGYEISVFIPVSLDGQAIEDVSYKTFRAWKLGAQGKDDGVLITWAPRERKIRIETGKGVGGQLTDIESHHIIRDRMAPLFRQGKNRQALESGIDGVAGALGGQPSTAGRRTDVGGPHGTHGAPRRSGVASFLPLLLIGGVFVVVILVVSFVSRRRRDGYHDGGGPYGGGYSSGPTFFVGGGGSDWGGGGGSSGDSGGSGGGDWGGGGGDTGGGGSSGDY